jgi:hypothetical protein
MIFGKSRYDGFVNNELFRVKDNFVTKTKVPPIIEGRVKAETPELELEIILKPTNGLILMFLIGVVVFIVIMLFVPNVSADGLISNLEKAGYALGFSAFLSLIVFLNAKDSYKRANDKLIETLKLREVDNIKRSK